MTVQRIVHNISCPEGHSAAMRRFYADFLGLNLLMDHGWIQTLGNSHSMRNQLSLASEGGNGTAVPALSIEVDDVDRYYERAQTMNYRIEYGPAVESWGVKRFYVRDPVGTLINILSHQT
ncbi:VOC family protein [Vandammella animalimorsus]|uniref:Glyoxalase n=1 Tax=Vandammella animalimorsus TaxID=2029117 RepID=A0A2A2ACB9_9BURK|nr:VOC family protein [Vandammella animalimorsus]PAT35239.1 glyoxalase [Vandammella animalimorsus]